MQILLFAAEEISNSPEPVINAVLAALEAKESAFLTNSLLFALIIIAGMVALGVGFVIVAVNQIRVHTNGMHNELVSATRKLALIEGEVKGRANQKIEDNPSTAGTPVVGGTRIDNIVISQTTESRTEDVPKPKE